MKGVIYCASFHGCIGKYYPRKIMLTASEGLLRLLDIRYHSFDASNDYRANVIELAQLRTIRRAGKLDTHKAGKFGERFGILKEI
ncbi:hypothetical protein XbrCFBP1976_18295 [Xanthomonas bromi]|uniref:Uncharacterized protein n=1 Tax=Xanthomonas bromi TaxID=56449 RepID=A0ABX5BKP8_9XANT|nr:hypothetical protein XbrCFBP1976_18295 [Xanthomonas bromi]